MRKAMTGLAILCAMLLGGATAPAQDLVDEVAKGCDKEIKTYCQGVTAGQGRVLACLYAYEDKLSNRCDYALYNAAVQLERAVNALSYLANECSSDMQKFCSTVQPGQGRLLDCLDRNKEQLSGRCKQALKDTGLR